jgi:PTS system mannose-specific IID component
VSVDAWTRARVFFRSFTIQGSWNYRTLIGNGFAFSLLPVLRSIYGQDPEALRRAVARHRTIFNSHPYLVGVALGAVARLEMEGAEVRTIDRFKAAIRGPLGSIGDGLVWAAWRPLCLITGLVLYYAGLRWAWVAIVFLGLYNAGHLALRIWGFEIGFRHGRDVGERLRRARLARIQKATARAGAFGLGLLVPVLLGSAATGLIWPWWAAAALAALAGIRLGNAVRLPLAIALILFIVSSIFLGGFGNG